jgi:hypothetical protein
MFRSSSTLDPRSKGIAPAGGVYVYAASGSEQLSFLNTTQMQGPTVPGTVTHRGPGCWTLRIEYNSFHSQERDFCGGGGRLVESGGSTEQRFDFVAFSRSEHSAVTCDPPSVLYDEAAAIRGHRLPLTCRTRSETTDTTMTSTGETVFVGRETINVDDAVVRTVHVRQNLVFEGDQTGSQVEDFWFAVDDWLPVRNERSIRVVSPAPAPIGSVTYTEEGSWQLTSLTPRT